jgi:hypothetical protein
MFRHLLGEGQKPGSFHGENLATQRPGVEEDITGTPVKRGDYTPEN